MVRASSPQTLESAGEIEEGSRLVKQHLWYLAIGALSYLAVTILERLAEGLQGQILRTEIYSIHGFSHVFFGIGLASIILFFRPRSSARVVILGVLLAWIAWELHEGYWLSGEPIDSVEDVVLAILSASTFLCLARRKDREPGP
jgi:hypothetical protein